MLKKYWFVAASLFVAIFAIADTPQPAKPAAPAATTTSSASAATVEGGTPAYVKSETPEERAKRLATPEDPGTNPDPKKVFYRYGRPFTIERYDRQWASYQDMKEGWVRPFALANFANEIYQQNEKYVWVWVEQPMPDQKTEPSDIEKGAEQPYANFTAEQFAYLKKIQPEFQTLATPQSSKTIRFEEASEGLPKAGSWRNSLAVADMNNDGCPDIIAPPQRGGGSTIPAIFLGDCKGNWKIWSTAIWPYGIQYGAVAAADFNKDGNVDLAFAIHLTGVRVWLGDGKGHFTDSSEGLPLNNFPTRRLAVADLDQDGWPDLLVINEGPTPAGERTPSNVRGFLNRKKGSEWNGVDAAEGTHVLGGDYLAVGNFNDDKTPDFAGSSVYYQASELIYESKGKTKWDPVKSDGDVVPYLSYYDGVTAGHFSSKKVDDVVMAYVRHWPAEVDPTKVPTPPLKAAVGLDRVTFAGGTPKRVPIVRWSGDRPILGVNSGDFDGDGKLDVVYTGYSPREVTILLGDGKGDFARAKLEGITAEANTNYDVIVADVNKDGKPDIILLYESNERSRFGVQDGSIHVFINRGAAGAAAPTKTATTK